MDPQTFRKSADIDLWAQMLDEAYPEVVEHTRAAYMETLSHEENVIYEGIALLSTEGRLEVYRLTSKGSRHDSQTETILQTVVPLSRVLIETKLERSGWGRGVDTRSINDKSFSATIHYGDESVTIPGDEGDRYRERARTFVEALTAHLA